MAQNFSPEAIKSRTIDKLRSKASWAEVLPFGTNQRIIDTVVDALAEEARFSTYLLREHKWSLAQNKTSLEYQAEALAYRPRRNIASSGYLRVSAFEDVVDLGNILTWRFDGVYNTGRQVAYENRVYEALSDNIYYDDGDSEKETWNPENRPEDWERVTGYSYGENIRIPRFSVFNDGEDTKFCTVNDFVLNGSDDYAEIEIRQGEPKTENRIAQGNFYETFDIFADNIAEDLIRVYVDDEEWDEISDIRLASDSEMVYELSNLPQEEGISIKFGNNIFGRRLTAGQSIRIEYVETKGITGNISGLNVVTEVESAIETDSGTVVDVYVTNEDPLTGGTDGDSIEDIRTNAPRLFQTGGRATSATDYQAILEQEFSFVSRAIAWGAYETNLDNGYPPSRFIPTEENVVRIAAFTTGGELLSQEQKNDLILPRLNELKAPTDIIVFEDPEICGLYFNSRIRVQDRSFTLSQVSNRVQQALAEEYSIDNLNFAEDLYQSDYIRFIDQIDGVAYHNTTLTFSNIRPLQVAYNTGAFNLTLTDLVEGSVRVYIRDITEVDPEWIQIGRDSGGAIVGTGDNDLAGSTITYATGRCLVIIEDAPGIIADLQGFSDFEVKVEYRSSQDNYHLSYRSQIFRYDGSDISASYV